MFGPSEDQQKDASKTTTTPAPGGPISPVNDITPPTPPSPSPDLNLPSTPSSLPGGFTPPKPLNDITASDSDETSAPSVPTPSVNPTEPADEEPFSPFTPPQPTSSETPTAEDDDSGALAASPNDLVRIKQDALQKLSPLVDHLDQTPEERFRTTMMMIQATDDSSKIKDAYEIAQKITDEKVKAQALLDVVNEINYFTQQQKEAEEK